MRLIALVVALMVPGIALGAVALIGNGAAVTCGTTPTVMDDPSVPNTSSRTLLACVPSTGNRIYVGGKGVSVEGGTEVEPGKCYRVVLAPMASAYCVAPAASPVRVQEAR